MALISSRKYQFLFWFFISTISLSLIIVGAIGLLSNTFNVVFISIGTSLFAGTIASILNAIFMKPSATPSADDPGKLGVVACYLNVGHITDPARFRQLVESAQSLDIIFNTGRYVMALYLPAIKLALEHNKCNLRILLSDPENPTFKNIDLSRGLSPISPDLPHEVESTRRRIKQELDSLKNKDAKAEIRLAKCMITGSMIIVDRKFLRYTRGHFGTRIE